VLTAYNENNLVQHSSLQLETSASYVIEQQLLIYIPGLIFG
jgi:hypothetical protein